MTLFLIILFTLLGGALSVIAAALFLLAPERLRERVLPHFISFAIGAMLSVAFIELLPHAMLSPGVRDIHTISFAVLFGLLGFFILEKMILWRHCHSFECEAHTPDHLPPHEASHGHEPGHGPQGKKAAGTLILLGDGLHNFVDGILIAAAFLTDTHLGIVTALAVATHEIPQEVGDFAVLLDSGYSRARAFYYNLLSSLTTVLGGLLAYFSMAGLRHLTPYVLAVAAASFIYIAVADLIPGLHRRLHPRATLQQISLILAGVAVIYFAHRTLH
jgi:zinc and cadmium transporter